MSYAYILQYKKNHTTHVIPGCLSAKLRHQPKPKTDSCTKPKEVSSASQMDWMNSQLFGGRAQVCRYSKDA